MSTILEGGGPSRAATSEQFQEDGVSNADESPLEIIGGTATMANREHRDCCPALALWVLGDVPLAIAAAVACEGR